MHSYIMKPIFGRHLRPRAWMLSPQSFTRLLCVLALSGAAVLASNESTHREPLGQPALYRLSGNRLTRIVVNRWNPALYQQLPPMEAAIHELKQPVGPDTFL